MELDQEVVQVIRSVLAALDYRALEEVYCDEGGDAFWAAKKPEVERLGLEWAAEAVRRLPPGGRSLYAGAGVVELPVMIAETLGLERSVQAANLRIEECAVLEKALAAGGIGGRLQVEPVDVRELATAGIFDHVAAVCLLTDPESFPNLSGLTYGTLHPAAVDGAAFAAEHERAATLADCLWDALVPEGVGWITTTFEEVPWFLERATRHGVEVAAGDTMVQTALVGDPIGFLRRFCVRRIAAADEAYGDNPSDAKPS